MTAQVLFFEKDPHLNAVENFYQFHEHISRSSRSQMFFKIGAFKNFEILILTY